MQSMALDLLHEEVQAAEDGIDIADSYHPILYHQGREGVDGGIVQYVWCGQDSTSPMDGMFVATVKVRWKGSPEPLAYGDHVELRNPGKDYREAFCKNFE
jgi:hypothetical protein